MIKIHSKASRSLNFPLKAYPLDIASTYKRVTGDTWGEQFVRPEFLNKRTRQSFEISFIMLMKALSQNN
jgi:hypothetical protein